MISDPLLSIIGKYGSLSLAFSFVKYMGGKDEDTKPAIESYGNMVKSANVPDIHRRINRLRANLAYSLDDLDGSLTEIDELW